MLGSGVALMRPEIVPAVRAAAAVARGGNEIGSPGAGNVFESPQDVDRLQAGIKPPSVP